MTVPQETAIAERTAQAREFMTQAEFEFAVGDTRQGAEKLYGAAVQAIIAASRQRGWNYQSHRANKNAAGRLATEYGDRFLAAGFATAEKLHIHFHHGDMEDYQLAEDRLTVRLEDVFYVERLLRFIEEYQETGDTPAADT